MAITEVTRVLNAIDQGNGQAAEELLPLVYDELRRLAAQKLSHEKPGQTLQATPFWSTKHMCAWWHPKTSIGIAVVTSSPQRLRQWRSANDS